MKEANTKEINIILEDELEVAAFTLILQNLIALNKAKSATETTKSDHKDVINNSFTGLFFLVAYLTCASFRSRCCKSSVTEWTVWNWDCKEDDLRVLDRESWAERLHTTGNCSNSSSHCSVDSIGSFVVQNFSIDLQVFCFTFFVIPSFSFMISHVYSNCLCRFWVSNLSAFVDGLQKKSKVQEFKLVEDLLTQHNELASLFLTDSVFVPVMTKLISCGQKEMKDFVLLVLEAAHRDEQEKTSTPDLSALPEWLKKKSSAVHSLQRTHSTTLQVSYWMKNGWLHPIWFIQHEKDLVLQGESCQPLQRLQEK